jgi:hypothetical protein
MTGIRDQWAAGSRYEDFMGRWSRRLAPEFVSWLQVPRLKEITILNEEDILDIDQEVPGFKVAVKELFI